MAKLSPYCLRHTAEGDVDHLIELLRMLDR
jgi:hypothetical protein